MKLILYSGGTNKENTLLDQNLVKMLPKDPVVTFIPSCSFESEIYFRDYIKRFNQYGIQKFMNFPVDIPCDPILEEEVVEK